MVGELDGDPAIMPFMRALAGVCAASALLWAGCGGGKQAPAKTSAPTATAAATAGSQKLLDALAEVKSGEAAHKALYWSNIAGLRQVAGYPDHTADLKVDDNRQSRWLLGLSVGAESLARGDMTAMDKVGERLGFDYLGAGSSTSIGEPPREAMRLDGVDGAAVAAAARRLGAKPVQSSGRTILARRDEGKQDFNDPLTNLGVLAGANRISAAGRTAALGAFDEPVDEVLGGGTSLADEGEYQAAAACLGDGALYAVIYPTSVVKASGTLVAVGARADGQNAVELACEVGVPPADAARHVAALRKSLGPNARLPGGEPVREIGTLAEAASGKAAGRTWVRAAVRLNRPVGFFTNELVRGDLPQYFGG
jgi:hypothetical protein